MSLPRLGRWPIAVLSAPWSGLREWCWFGASFSVVEGRAMPIAVQCTGCGGRFRAPDEAAGKRVKCPKCSTTIDVSRHRTHRPLCGSAEKPSRPPPHVPPRTDTIHEQTQKSPRPLLWAWAGGGAVTLLLLVGLLRLFLPSKPPTEKSVAAPVSADKSIASGGQKDETIHSKDTSAEPTCFDVRSDIKRYVGRRVAWVAHQATYSHSTDVKTGEETTSYVFLARDAKGQFFAENAFVFENPGSYQDTKRTPAAEKADNTPGDEGTRLVMGTIAGSTTATFSGDSSTKVK